MKSEYGGKNVKMDFQRRFSHFEAGESALSSRQDSNNFTSSAGHRDLPEIYILVLVSRLCTISSLFDVNLFSHVYPALRQILLSSRLRFSGIRIDLLFTPKMFRFDSFSLRYPLQFLFFRSNYNNCLLLNNLSCSVESYDVDK